MSGGLSRLPQNATARPWTRDPRSKYGIWRIWRGTFFGLIARTEPDANPNAEADADLIVFAVNRVEGYAALEQAARRAVALFLAFVNETDAEKIPMYEDIAKVATELEAALAGLDGSAGDDT